MLRQVKTVWGRLSVPLGCAPRALINVLEDEALFSDTEGWGVASRHWDHVRHLPVRCVPSDTPVGGDLTTVPKLIGSLGNRKDIELVMSLLWGSKHQERERERVWGTKDVSMFEHLAHKYFHAKYSCTELQDDAYGKIFWYVWVCAWVD